MATYYVSNTATNGYGIGSDSNSTALAQNKATPWLTMTKAVTSSASGDSIVVNGGNYTIGSQQNISAKASTWTADGAVIVSVTFAGFCFYMSPASDIDFTFTGFTFNGNNLTAVAAFYSENTAQIRGITVTSCTFVDIKGAVTLQGPACRLLFENNTVSGRSSGIVAASANDLTSGYVNINNTTINITDYAVSGSSAFNLFNIEGGVAGSTVTAYVTNCTGSVYSATAVFTGSMGFARIVNINNSYISYNTIGLFPPGTGGAEGCAIVCGVVASGYECLNPLIEHNTLTSPKFGHAILLGNESGAADTARDGLKYGIARFNTVTSTGIVGHMVMVGGSYECFCYGNHVTGGDIGLLGKDSTRPIFTGNIVIDSSVHLLRFKAVDTGYMVNNTAIAYSLVPLSFIFVEPDGVTADSVDCLFANNICYAGISIGTTTGGIVNVDNGQTATFNNNNYYLTSDNILTSTRFSYQTTNATYSGWVSGFEATATIFDPQFTDYPTFFNLKGNSSLVGIGKYYFQYPLIPLDFQGRPYNNPATIGAYEFSGGDPISGTRSVASSRTAAGTRTDAGDRLPADNRLPS